MNPLQTLWMTRARRLRVGRARRCVGRGGRVGAWGGGVGRRVGQGPALDVGGDVARLGRERRHRDGGQDEHDEEHGAGHRGWLPAWAGGDVVELAVVRVGVALLLPACFSFVLR